MAGTEVDTAARDTVDRVRAAQAGDPSALAELVSAHLPLVYNVVGRALNGHADVDDVVQETMLRVIHGLPGVREPDRFRSWLVSIAYRQVQLHLRSRSRALFRRQEASTELPDPSGDFADRTVTELVLTGQRRELAEAARWLDDGDRQMLSLWWQEAVGELTRSELATALAVNTRHASVRLVRMKSQLETARVVVRALQASPRCPDLGSLVQPWNGVADSVWRKRLGRHVRECARCGLCRNGLVAPEKLLLGLGTVPVAAGLTIGLPTMTGPAAPAVLSSLWATIQSLFTPKVVASTAVVAVAAGGFAYAVIETPMPYTEAAPAVVRPTTGPSPSAPVGAGAPSGAGTRPSSTPTTRAPGTTGVTNGDIHVAPAGSDSGTGSVDQPYATLGRAVAAVRPGQTIVLRGGTYRPVEPVLITTSGTADSRITISNYRGEQPVIDGSGVPAEKWLIEQRASYWTVQGLEIINSRSHAYVCLACRYTVFQRLSIHDNTRSGLLLRDTGTIGNQVLDSDFFRNRDPASGGSVGIGLGIKFGSGAGNLVRGNRAFDNADNGFDLGEFASPVAVEYNWAYGNGVNRWGIANWRSNADGFHLGGGDPPVSAAHQLRHNAAWRNVHDGFADAGNRGAMQLSNNTAYRNGSTGFSLPAAAATLRSNSAVEQPRAVAVGAAAKLSRNDWQDGADDASTFRSVEAATAEGDRTPAGTLPPTNFLTTGNGVGASMSGR